MSIFYVKELDQFYTAALAGVNPLIGNNPLPIQYRDFYHMAEAR